MKKLCIHIFTSYDNYIKNEQKMLWNAEIEIDKNTIHSVFQEDTIIDLQVQASTDKGAKKEEIARCVIEPLRQTSLNDYQECHIILNTHGAASSNDLSDEIVKEVVAFISNHEIKIVQMSALQCNGLKGQTAREYREANPFTPQHQQVNDKPSSMAILQAKLSSMHTQIQQSFPICGFMTAYDPKKDRNKVEELLLNGSSVSLTVATQQAPKEDLQVVRQHIKICKKYAEKQAKGLNISSDFMSQYSQATNAFGRILHKMTQNIGNYLGGTQQLTAASIVLYETVTGFKSAYEPSTDKNMVVDLLLGNKQGETAHVFTRQRKKKNFETLLQYINLCRDVHNKQCMDYIKVTNELGKTLHSIAQDIRNYLEGYCELEPASITFYQNLFDQSHVEPEKKPSVSEFEYRYKKWLKENKMTSAKRLNVLVAYCSYNLEQAVDMRPYNNNKFFRPISPPDSPSDCSKCDVDDLVLKP